jgi:hypothetical protein
VSTTDVAERSLTGDDVFSCAMGQLIDMADWELLPLVHSPAFLEPDHDH